MPDWTPDEMVMAIEFYYGCPERMHTDAHAKCQEIAAMLERTPGALDRIIRNIKFVDGGGAGLEHASALIHQLVGKYRGNPELLRQDAAAIHAKNGWPALDCGA